MTGTTRFPLPVPSRRGWAVALVAVAILYFAAVPLSNGDIRNHLLPWTHYILSHGRVAALANHFSEYTPPYLYLLSIATLLNGAVSQIAIVKIVAIAGTLFLAGAMRLLLGLFMSRREAWTGGAASLILPTVAANGPVWGQCDAWWSGFILLFVWAAASGRMALAAAMLGMGVAFKLQAVFVAPLVLALLLAGRMRWRTLLLAPATCTAAMLPACAIGRPVRDLATIYLAQGEYFRDLARSVPNIWQILRAVVTIPYTLGVAAGLTLTAAAVVALAWVRRRQVGDPAGVLLTAFAAAMIVPYLLPKMHNRYFFLADVLALAYALAQPSRRATRIMILVQIASLLAYSVFLLRVPGGAFVGAFAMTAALVLVLRELRDQSTRSPPFTTATGCSSTVTSASGSPRTATISP